MPSSTWTDEQLRSAIEDSTSWRAVQRALGLRATGPAHWLRRRAAEIGVDYSHFASGRRPWSDADLRAAVAASTTWAQTGELLGSKPAHIRDRARELEIDTSHLDHISPRPAGRLPFGRPVTPDGRFGLSVAARWFLERGYPVSVPLEPTCYDLIAESDEGLVRVQVKTTRRRARSGRYTVALTRTIYDSEVASNSGGKYRQVPYLPSTVDYFFVITSGGDGMYLIPFGAVAGKMSIVLDHKYAAFKVD